MVQLYNLNMKGKCGVPKPDCQMPRLKGTGAPPTKLELMSPLTNVMGSHQALPSCGPHTLSLTPPPSLCLSLFPPAPRLPLLPSFMDKYRTGPDPQKIEKNSIGMEYVIYERGKRPFVYMCLYFVVRA